MSEPQAMAMQDGTAPAPSALRAARERAGLHVVALAAMLKVPVSKLEALEQGRYEQLPDMTFARALAKSVCRQLKIDPAPVLQSLPEAPEVALGRTSGQGKPRFVDPREQVAADGLVLSRSAIGAMVLLLVALGAWWLLPLRQALDAATSDTSGAASAVAPVAPPAASQTPPVESVTAPAVQAVPASAEPAGAEGSPTATQPAAEATVTAVEATAHADATSAGAALLQLSVRDTSWVEVVDKRGNVLLQRELTPGEAPTFEAERAPLEVTVGRVDVTTVRVRGQTLELADKARNNVARFRVE